MIGNFCLYRCIIAHIYSNNKNKKTASHYPLTDILLREAQLDFAQGRYRISQDDRIIVFKIYLNSIREVGAFRKDG